MTDGDGSSGDSSKEGDWGDASRQTWLLFSGSATVAIDQLHTNGGRDGLFDMVHFAAQNEPKPNANEL